MSKSSTVDLERLAAMFKALSHPQRLRMFVKLASRCCISASAGSAGVRATYCCVGDLGADAELAASTVSHHLKELRQAGLMQVERNGQKIDCWISEETLRLLASFFQDCGRQSRAKRSA
jgi:ArsR family transcriptional regulator